MASYQARQRDPLLDQNMQALLERRGRELMGLVLVALALMFAVMLWTYSPEDPGWMVATDEVAQNTLGRFGAAVASTLMIIGGKGAWGIPVILFAWGVRFVLHRGAERALGRVVFALITVALASVYAATLVPAVDWGHSFGLGGLFGDTVLGAVLGMSPVGSGFGLKLISLVSGLALIGMGLFVTGFDLRELRAIGQFLLVGLVVCYQGLISVLGQGATTTARLAQDMKDRQVAKRSAAAHAALFAAPPADSPHAARPRPAPAAKARPAAGPIAGPTTAGPTSVGRAQTSVFRPAPPLGEPDLQAAPDLQAEPARKWSLGRAVAALRDTMSDQRQDAVLEHRQEPEDFAAPSDRTPSLWGSPAALRAEPRLSEPAREKVGLLARMPFMRRPADHEDDVLEATLYPEDDLPSEDRIKARINDVIRSRARQPQQALTPLAAAIQRREPQMMRPRGPAPLIADTRKTLPVLPEPPVVAGQTAVTALSAAAMPVLTASRAPARPATQPAPRAALPPEPPVVSRRVAPPPPPPVIAPEDDWSDAQDFTPDYDPTPPVQRPTPQIDPRKAVVQHPANKPIPRSSRAMAEAQPRLRFDDPAPAYELPPLSLLSNPVTIQRHALSDDALEENARMLESVLDDYGVKGEIVAVRPGPVVTMYELEPAPGLKASRVVGLADDIARSMSALSARVSTVPGRTVIGIELPNAVREKVVLREILAARDFGDSTMRLPLALGKDIGGEPIVANLAKMPHLLIAGTTGSGKSVAINTMILSLLYKLSPDECRLIMIDPKMLELSVYDGIPHLLSPVVTDPKKAVVALKWVVSEMEERYRKMSKLGVRNIEGYNGRVREALANSEMFKRTIQTGFDEDTGEPVFETDEYQPVTLPYIVVVVDEMADLMMVAGKEIEACIQRLAQMARASGIHLIMATQRPSVDVITGTIKANFPTRISFQVTSKIDSRTILGEQGAEQLLGMGDMLYMAGGAKINRIHGPFVSDEEVEEIVNHLKSYGPPVYMSGVVEGPEDEAAAEIDSILGLGSDGLDDTLYDQAVAIVAKDRKCSTSYIQRKLGIGYNKAAKLVEQMEEHGVVTPANHVGKREILVEER